MALQKAHLPIRFHGGIETKTDGKVVPATKLTALENGVFTKGISIVKRHGYDALPTAVLGSATGYTGAKAIAARGSELLLFTDDRCYSYVEGASQWSDAGAVQSVLQSDRPVAKAPATQTLGDYAAVDGIGIAAWEDSRGGVYWCVTEDDGGRIVQAVAEASSTGTRPRCVRVGDKLAVLWAEEALGQIKAIFVDPTAPHTYNATLFPAVIIADLDTSVPTFDAEYIGTTGSVHDAAASITWNTPAGIRVGWIDPSGVIGSPVTGWASPITLATAAAVTAGPVIAAQPWDQDKWAIVYATSTNAYVEEISAVGDPITSDGAVALTGAGIEMVACAWRSGTTSTRALLEVWLENRTSPARTSTVSLRTYDTNNASVTSTGTWRGVALASRGWTDCAQAYTGGTVPRVPYANAYVHLIHDVPLFGVYLAMRHDGLCVARTLPGLAGDAPARSHLPSVFDDGSQGRVYRWIAGAKAQLDGINGDVFTEQGLRLVSLDFDDPDSFQTAQVGSSLYLGGACPMVYDGHGWVEHNFHFGIDWETTETLHTQGTGGSLNTTGTYSWIFVPEYTLANGEIVLGPPSKPYEVTLTGSNNKVTFNVPLVSITAMTASSILGAGTRVEARIGVYRSLDGDASVYYRCSSLDPSATGDNGYLSNATNTFDSMSFVDAMSDATLATKEPLYTSGGILENDPVPGTGVLVGGKGRLFTTDPSDANVVLFSQERASGRAMEMPDGLRIQVDDQGGAITALGVLDDALIVFKRSAIYHVSGPGPLSNPELGGGFSAPARITSDVGCTEAKSIVQTPLGLMFKSAKGIYLLDRGHQVSYVGAPVESYNDQAIVRATLVEDATQVRFLTSSGSTLLYDYLFGQWSTFTNHEGLDAIVVDGTYHYLRTDGRVFVEDSTGYDDAGNRIPLVMETAWIHLQEHLQGFQRVWFVKLLGEWQSAHKLRFQYRLDYQNSWSEPIEFDWSTVGGSVYGEGVYGDGTYGGTAPTVYQMQIHIGRACEAIQLRISDYETAGTAGAAFEITELLITGGVKGPAFKLPAARSA